MRDARDLVRCWKLQMEIPTRGKGPGSYIARVPLDSSAPTSTTSGFIAYFESFCAQRGVAQLLRLQQPHPGNPDMTLTYSYIPNEGRDSCPGYSVQFITVMYHGTNFYAICMILASGGLIDAKGVDLGTTFLTAKGIEGCRRSSFHLLDSKLQHCQGVCDTAEHLW